MNQKTQKVLLFISRLAVFLLLAPIVFYRIYNIIPLLGGIILIWKDDKHYGRIFGWLLALGSVAYTAISYYVYSVPGGLFY